MHAMQDLENLLTTIIRDRIKMNFKSVSVNNCYILRDEIFDNRFFTYINAKAIYSASIFHLAFFKGNIKLLPDSTIREYEQSLIRLYRLNSPYLYIPFEINFHEDKLYQSYYESDHFPLSVWLEERNLIPFDIFIRIIEDILFALKILEKNGISHLFLTPEEILIPLQWTTSNHVKLYNVEINLIASSLMNDEEIRNYRNNYYKNNTIKKTDKLLLNISEDLYSFGIIANKLFTFCNFNDDETKNKLQKILNNIINNTNNFNSIEDVISLFDDFFSGTNRQNILPYKTGITTYSDQAGFIIPEYNEWHEEAKLESLSEIKVESSNRTVIKTEQHYRNTHIKNIDKSMEERNYTRTYKIMQESINETPKKERSKQELRFKNLLDEKLKQLDNHYVKDTNTNILEKIAIINTIQPMIVLKNNKDSEDFNTLLKRELISGDSKKITNSNNLSFFIRLLNFIKNKIKNIIN